MKYADYVSLGRELLRQVRCYQVQIAFYATRVCEIRHGGISRDIYTLKRYAQDIGVGHKTLQSWVQIYRNVVSKLDIDIKDIGEAEWGIASRVNNLLKFEKTLCNANDGTPGRKRNGTGYRQRLGKTRIRRLYRLNLKGPTLQNSVYTWTETIIVIKNKIRNMDMDEVSPESLTFLKGALDAASGSITEYLIDKGDRRWMA